MRCEIWVKELSGGDWAVCVFNDGGENLTFDVNWEHLSFLNGKYQIRDLWKKKDIGTNSKKMEFVIPSHDVLMLKMKKIG